MENRRDCIAPSEDAIRCFCDEALEEANRDFLQLFLQMFTEARRYAVEEYEMDVNFEINRATWQRGKWSVLERYGRRGRHGGWLGLLRFANALIAVVVGYGFSEPADRYWLIIVSVVVWSATFLIEQRLEKDR